MIYLIAFLQRQGIKRNSRSLSDYEQAKRIISLLADNPADYQAMIHAACEFIGV